jgi:hypothetical protein
MSAARQAFVWIKTSDQAPRVFFVAAIATFLVGALWGDWKVHPWLVAVDFTAMQVCLIALLAILFFRVGKKFLVYAQFFIPIFLLIECFARRKVLLGEPPLARFEDMGIDLYGGSYVVILLLSRQIAFPFPGWTRNRRSRQ